MRTRGQVDGARTYAETLYQTVPSTAEGVEAFRAASARDVGRRRLGPRYTGYKNHAYDMDNSGTVPQGHQWVNYRMKGIMNLPLRNGVTPYRVNDVPPYFKSEDDPVTPPDIV